MHAPLLHLSPVLLILVLLMQSQQHDGTSLSKWRCLTLSLQRIIVFDQSNEGSCLDWQLKEWKRWNPICSVCIDYEKFAGATEFVSFARPSFPTTILTPSISSLCRYSWKLDTSHIMEIIHPYTKTNRNGRRNGVLHLDRIDAQT